MQEALKPDENGAVRRNDMIDYGMKNKVANIITGSRVIFSVALLFASLSSTLFCALYLICGFTDMIDGTVARKMGAVSEFGARLDTVSDFVFIFVCAVKILPILRIPVWLWVWIALIALTKILNIALVFIAKKKLISVHSVFNKITGFALFLLPFTLTFVPTTYSVSAICVLATVAVAQEVYLVARRREVV